MNSELYWIERVRKANAKIIARTEEEVQKKLITAYKKAYKEMVSGEIFEILQEYSDSNGEISLTKLLKYNRLKKMTEKFKDIVEELGGEEINFLNRTLPEIYKEAGGSASKGVGVEIDWSIVPKEQINRAVNYPWSGEHYSDRIWENKRKLVRNLSQTVTQGIIQGKSISDMMKDLQDKMEKGAYECRRIVRTETMHMVNAGAIDRYKAAGVTELEYVMSQDYYSNGKPRYCQTCAADKGAIFPIDNAPILPRHPNCRCTYVPVIESMKLPKNGETKAKEEVKEAVEVETKEVIKEEQKVGFTPAKTIKEAEKFVREVLGIPNTGYGKADVKTANEWNKALFDTFEKFPELKNNFKFVGTIQQRQKFLKTDEETYRGLYKDGMEAYLGQNKHLLKVMSREEAEKLLEPHVIKYIKNYQRKNWNDRVFAQSWELPYVKGVTVNEDYASKYDYFNNCLVNTVKNKFHPVGCETIRSVLDHEIGHQLDDLLGLKENKEISGLWKELSKKEITEGLSEYAWRNNNKKPIGEFIAEGWAEYCNNPEPRPIAQKIGETILKEYKNKFGGN